MRRAIISKWAAHPVAHAALCPGYTHLFKCCPQPALLMLVLPCIWAQQRVSLTLSSSRPNAWTPQDLFVYFRIRDKKSSSAGPVHSWFSLPHLCCIKVTKLSIGSTVCNVFLLVVPVLCKFAIKHGAKFLWSRNCSKVTSRFCCKKGCTNYPTRDLSACWSHSL